MYSSQSDCTWNPITTTLTIVCLKTPHVGIFMWVWLVDSWTWGCSPSLPLSPYFFHQSVIPTFPEIFFKIFLMCLYIYCSICLDCFLYCVCIVTCSIFLQDNRQGYYSTLPPYRQYNWQGEIWETKNSNTRALCDDWQCNGHWQRNGHWQWTDNAKVEGASGRGLHRHGSVREQLREQDKN